MKIHLLKMLNAFLPVRTKEFSRVYFKENLNALFLTEMFIKNHRFKRAFNNNNHRKHLFLALLP